MTVTNVEGPDCGGTLVLETVEVVAWSPSAAFQFRAPDRRTLPPGQSTQVEVTFDPPADGEFQAKLQFVTNDADTPFNTIPLAGVGHAPVPEVTHSELDYGRPYIGCDNGWPLTLTNRGREPLTVRRIELLTLSEREFDLDLDGFTNGELPFTLAAGGPTQSLDVWLDYVPLDLALDEAVVSFTTNDPRNPTYLVTAQGVGTRYQEQTDIFEIPVRDRVDVLFTMERTERMRPLNDAMIRSFPEFFDMIVEAGVDVHAAATVADNGCILGPDDAIDPTFTPLQAAATFSTMADLDFVLSGYGSNTERPFMLAEAALSSKNIAPTGCNRGFYREEARLALVAIANGSGTTSGFHYVRLFQALKADPRQVKIYSFAGDYPGGCTAEGTRIGPFEEGYYAALATGGRYYSLCDDNLIDAAYEIAYHEPRFPLTHQPVPETIEVFIDGVRVNVGWEYEISSNSVVFDTDFVPTGGSTVDIKYQALPDCEG